MLPHNIYLITTLLLLFASAIVGAIVAKRLKQPLLLGYIAVGVVIGNLVPSGFIDRAFLELVSDVGVTLLLFTLGVEFSFHRLRRVLGTVGWAAVVQVFLSVFLFLFFFLFFQFPFLPALFFAVACSLSSTAVVVKILSERGELETIPGEITTAWLIVQDLAVVPIMVVLPALVSVANGQTTSIVSMASIIGISLLKAVAFLVAIIYLGRKGVPKILNSVAKLGSRETFLITTVGIVFVAGIGAFALGLSAALGAFIAGLLIADTSQHHAIFAEVRPLRDVFAVVFFVSLGLALPFSVVVHALPLLVGITVVVLLLKWFIVMGLARFVGYHRKTAFLVAVALVQMSEFGFIIAREGNRLGAVSADQYVLLVAVTFLTICISAPLLAQGHGLYYMMHRLVGKKFPKLFSEKEETLTVSEELPIADHIIICGYGRVGKYIGRALTMAGIPFLVIDYNHTTVASLREKGTKVIFGDPADKDILVLAHGDTARAVVIAIPDNHTQELIISNALTLSKRIRIICRTHHEEDQARLKALGVHTIVQPEFEAALSIVEKLLGDFGVAAEEIAGKVSRLKLEHGMG